jgi:hypothetical protein
LQIRRVSQGKSLLLMLLDPERLGSDSNFICSKAPEAGPLKQNRDNYIKFLSYDACAKSKQRL